MTIVRLDEWLVILDFNSIYERLGVTITERGESFYQPMMADIVADMESKSQSQSLYI